MESKQSSSALPTLSDNQSLSSAQKSEVSKKKEKKKSKEDGGVSDKQRLKVLKEAYKDLQKKFDGLEGENKQLKQANDDVQHEMDEFRKRNTSLLEENSRLNDVILELQQKRADELGIMTPNELSINNH